MIGVSLLVVTLIHLTFIKHNKEVMAKEEISMGLSIERETLALELVTKELAQLV